MNENEISKLVFFAVIYIIAQGMAWKIIEAHITDPYIYKNNMKTSSEKAAFLLSFFYVPLVCFCIGRGVFKIILYFIESAETLPDAIKIFIGSYFNDR